MCGPFNALSNNLVQGQPGQSPRRRRGTTYFRSPKGGQAQPSDLTYMNFHMSCSFGTSAFENLIGDGRRRPPGAPPAIPKSPAARPGAPPRRATRHGP